MFDISDLGRLHRGVSFDNLVAAYLLGNDDDLENLAPTPMDTYAFVFVQSGTATLCLDTIDYPLDSHTAYVVSPMHRSHWHSLSPDFTAVALIVSPRMMKMMPVPNVEQHIEAALMMYNKPIFRISDEERQMITNVMNDCRQQMLRTDNPYQRELVTNALGRFYLEWDILILNYIESVHQQRGGNRQTALFFQFINLLSTSYRDRLGVAYYAEKMNITPQYLSSIVKRETSHSVASLASIMLYREACNMLIFTDKSIKIIADELKFADQASFNKFFRRHAAMSPSDYRDRNK